jgi:hypothetical protein
VSYALLGAAELGVGLLLVLGALSYAARALIVGVGVLMVLGGVLIGAGGSLGRMIRTRHSVKTNHQEA